jgi:hypothetical protein
MKKVLLLEYILPQVKASIYSSRFPTWRSWTGSRHLGFLLLAAALLGTLSLSPLVLGRRGGRWDRQETGVRRKSGRNSEEYRT